VRTVRCGDSSRPVTTPEPFGCCSSRPTEDAQPARFDHRDPERSGADGEDGDGEDDNGGDNWIRVLTAAGTIANLAKVIQPLDLHYWDAEDFPEPGAIGASETSGPVFTSDGKHRGTVDQNARYSTSFDPQSCADDALFY
jgi:hypothetical protein